LITFINIKIYANLGGAREGRKTISTGGEEGQAETDISAADLPSRPRHAPVGWAGAPVMRGAASRITVLPLEQPQSPLLAFKYRILPPLPLAKARQPGTDAPPRSSSSQSPQAQVIPCSVHTVIQSSDASRKVDAGGDGESP
jgi:hypothetical protein